MEKIWAPWRAPYITEVVKKKRDNLFTRILKEKKDKKNFIFARSKYSFGVLNIFPYNNGHVLIIPKRRVSDLSKLKREEREDLMDLLEITKSILDDTMKPHGYNIGINLGRAAGAGIPQHLHIHLVPRWRGDVNFMPITGNVKVISQSLESLYEKLAQAYQRRIRRSRK